MKFKDDGYDFDKEHINSTGAINLAGAIISQTIKDFCFDLAAMRRKGKIEDWKIQYYKRTFYGGWFSDLTLGANGSLFRDALEVANKKWLNHETKFKGYRYKTKAQWKKLGGTVKDGEVPLAVQVFKETKEGVELAYEHFYDLDQFEGDFVETRRKVIPGRIHRDRGEYVYRP